MLRQQESFHLGQFFDAVLLWQQMTTPAFTAFVYTAFGALCLWYLLFSLPIVVDELLRWESVHGRVQHSKLWALCVRASPTRSPCTDPSR